MKLKIILLLFLALLLLFYGCSSSKGSIFRDTHDSDKGKKSSSNDDDDFTDNNDSDFSILFPDDDDYEEETEGLFVDSYPQGAEVYLDYRYYGTTPVFIPDLETGNYILEIRLSGYKKHETPVYYHGEYMKYSIVLDPVTGYFRITTIPADADISLGNHRITRELSEIPIGSYTLSVRKFGYTDYSDSVTIYEDQTTAVSVELVEADFSISGLSAIRKAFNPGNPGTLGKTTISFYVTSFGSGTLTITDENREEVAAYTFAGFRTWYQYYEWDGRMPDRTICPDGAYTIIVKAESAKDGTEFVLASQVIIDSSLSISYRILWNGISGFMYTGMPDILPQSSFGLSTTILAHLEQYGEEIIFRAPSGIGLRIGLGNNLETDIFFSAIFTDNEFVPFIGSLALKYLFLKSGGGISLESSVYGKVAYHYGTGADTHTNFTGISAGIPLKISIGMVSLVINPEIIASPFKVTYDEDYDTSPGFDLWAYGRFGIMVDAGTLITGISGAVRTTSLLHPEVFGISSPLELAYELHLMIPGSGIYFSLYAATEFESFDNYYIMSGIGAGFVY